MMTTTNIAPWPAPTTPEPRVGPAKRRRHYWIDVVLGLGLTGAGVAVVCFAAMALLTSNSCGMFADDCDTYGQSAPGFEHYVLATLLSLGAVPAFFFALIGRAIFHSRMRVVEPRVPTASVSKACRFQTSCEQTGSRDQFRHVSRGHATQQRQLEQA